MKPASFISLTFLALIATKSLAQNELPVLKPGDNIQGVLTVKMSEQNTMWYDYNVAAPSKEMIAAIPQTVDYTRAASLALNSFQKYPLGDYGQANSGRAIISWIKTGFDSTVKPGVNDKSSAISESIKKTVLGNRKLRDMIYSWMMPYFQKAFSIMSVPEQQGYIAEFTATREFVTNLDLKKEGKVVKEAPYYPDVVGYLQAFVYRRIANKELTGEECTEWLTRIINDLSAVQNKNPDPEDQYILKSQHQNEYYIARRFNGKYMQGESVIMNKRQGKYSIVPHTPFERLEPCGNNFFTGRHDNGEQPDTYGYVYYDSEGAFYRQTTKPLPADTLVLRGTGRSARAMFFYYPERYETLVDGEYEGEKISVTGEIGMFMIVDIDSGRVIRDSVYIPVERALSNNRPIYPSLNSAYVIIRADEYNYYYGLLGPNGDIILQPTYYLIEATKDPDLFELDSEKLFDVRTGKQTQIK
jgi:hypothetical protein